MDSASTNLENDFSQGSIARNILNLALPMTLAQLINVLYSVVDRIYIGHIPHVSADALTGVGLALPVITVITAFANLFGMGGAPLCSIARGEHEEERAENVMGNSFTLLLISGAVLMTVCLMFREPILYLFGASDVTYPYADQYITIYLLGTLFVMTSLGMNNFINAQGFGKTGMLTVLLGAVLNIILDPILIFGFDMGVRGAAVATVISQGASALWVFRFLTGEKALLKIKRKSMRLKKKLVREITLLGTSGFVMSVTNGLVQIVCNAVLSRHGGDLYVGIMTVINSVREIINMPLTGLTSGAQPVIGYNYGAGEEVRVKRIFFTVLVMCVLIMFLGTLLSIIFPSKLIGLFTDNQETITKGSLALRIISGGFSISSVSVAASGALEGLGKGFPSLVISLLRYIVIIIPLAYFLSQIPSLGAEGVWHAFWLSEVVTAVFSFMILRSIFRKRV